MITIKIDNKEVSIPTVKELTVRQYTDLMPYIARNGLLDTLRYISVTTGINYTKSLDCKITGLERFKKMIGDFKFILGAGNAGKGLNYIESIKPKLLVKHNRKILDFRKFKPDAIGFRVLLEQFSVNKPNYIELYLFMAAAVLNSDNGYDYEDAVELKDSLYSRPALEILSFGAFFFWKWSEKEKKDSLLSRTLRKVISTSIGLSARTLVLTDLRNIRASKKSK